MKTKLILALVSIALVGCSDKDAASPASVTAPEINPKFREKVLKSEPMTPELHTQATSILKTSSTKLPGITDIMESATIEAALVKSTELDQDGRQVLTKIYQSCTIERGAEKEVYRKGSGVGQSTIHSKKSTVAGQGCPVEMSDETTTGMVIKGINQDTKRVSFDRTSDVTSSTVVTDENLKKSSGTLSLITKDHATINAVEIDPETQGEITAGYVSFDGNSRGEIKLTDGTTIPIAMEMGGVVSPGRKNLAMVMSLKFAKGELQIAAFIKDGQAEYTVNGQPATPQEIKADFGFDIEADLKGIL